MNNQNKEQPPIYYSLENTGFRAYGAALELWNSKHPEVMLAGPYETGKTFCALNKLHLLCAKYPRCRALMTRKFLSSLSRTAIVTYEEKVLPIHPRHPDSLISVYGGSRAAWYEYPNGSRILLGGLDNPDKILSGEYDYIYVNQAEELSIDDWEKLSSRCTGRAGNAPYPQMIGDCNPADEKHWILKRDRLKIFHSKHKDNPTLYDPETGELTEQGKRTMDTLHALTGLRRKRGLEGQWVGAEGQVYEFDRGLHLVENFDIPKDWIRFRSIDFGYTNPFVCQWWAVSPDDRMYMYREIYHTQRTVSEHCKRIKELSKNEQILYTICDHDAEDVATLNENGIPTRLADKRVRKGVDAVEERLNQVNPRLFFFNNTLDEFDYSLEDRNLPIRTIEEFSRYIYRQDSKGMLKDEHPIKSYDHGMDAMRYAVLSQEPSLDNLLLKTPLFYTSAKVNIASPSW